MYDNKLIVGEPMNNYYTVINSGYFLCRLGILTAKDLFCTSKRSGKVCFVQLDFIHSNYY